MNRTRTMTFYRCGDKSDLYYMDAIKSICISLNIEYIKFSSIGYKAYISVKVKCTRDRYNDLVYKLCEQCGAYIKGIE